jgi:hypothetical protein
VATADYTGIRGIHLLMPVWAWSLNNIPLQDYSLGQHLFDQVPNPFFGQSQTFNSQPTVQLSQLLGLSPQYSSVTPGQATWGRSFANFLNLQIQSRGYHGLTLLASYSIRKTLTNTWGKDIQHTGPFFCCSLQNPHNLMEAYGVAGYEMPQTLLLNYSYEIPFGRGRQFMSNGTGIGYKVLNQVIGGWNLAGVSTWNPKGTPVLVPQTPGGQTAPGAALRESLVPGVKVVQSTNYTKALVSAGGNFITLDPNDPNFKKGLVLNDDAFADTPDFGFSNAPLVFPNVRNPGSFFTDATLLKKFPLSAEGSRYFEIRLEAQNIFNHANFNQIDNNKNNLTFGGILGKSGQRIMQIGARIFF